MRLYRVTYTEKNGTLHTYVVGSADQIVAIRIEARRKHATVFVEKLTVVPTCIFSH